MQEFTCIVCPKGCRVFVEDGEGIKGAGCERGVQYVQGELENPVRLVTSTVRLLQSDLPRLPVKTSAPIQKDMMMRAAALLNDVTVTAPVKNGDAVLKNILGTGVDFVATKSVK